MDISEKTNNVETEPVSKIVLRAIGQGFFAPQDLLEAPKDRATQEKEEKISEEIQYFRGQILYDSAKRTKRSIRDERMFTCKPWFIIKQHKRINSPEIVLALLADQRTLFSLKYQNYQSEHPVCLRIQSQNLNYATEGEKGTVTTKGQIYDICKQQTFEAIESETDQKILDCIDYEKVKNTYIQALTEIEQWAGSKKKSFTEIEMWLIDETIKRAESPDSQIDPKTKAEITNAVHSIRKRLEKPDKDMLDSTRRATTDFAYSDAAAKEIIKKYPGEEYIIRRWKAFEAYSKFMKQVLVEKNIIKQKWSEDAAKFFIATVLSRYFQKYKIIIADQEACGHYKISFNNIDIQYGENYRLQKDRLQGDLHRLMSYFQFNKQEDLMTFPRITIFPDKTFKVEQAPENYKQIEELTKEYLKNAYSIPSEKKKIDESLILSVIDEVEDLFTENTAYQRPLYFSLICYFGRSNFFTNQGSSISEKRFENLNKPGAAKISDRIILSQIELLHGLHGSYELSEDEKEKSWKNFFFLTSLTPHKLYSLLVKQSSAQAAKIKLNIFPIFHEIEKTLDRCMPIQEELLYSYRDTSKIQGGGFSDFLKLHPYVVDTLLNRFLSSKRSPRGFNQYLKNWGAIENNVSEIKEICEMYSRTIYWNTIPCTSDQNLMSFCEALYQHPSKETEDDNELKSDMQELKTLLVEATIRKYFAEKAKDILNKKIEKVLFGEKEIRKTEEMQE